MLDTTSHPNWDAASFLASKPRCHWLANHPTFCFRRAEITAIGSYNALIKGMMEDFDLLVRVLKSYGQVHNMPDVLLLYRLHEAQVTHGQGGSAANYAAREAIVHKTWGDSTA